jgi:hypothetical protein
MGARDFQSEAAAAEALSRSDRVTRLREIHEAWARDALGLPVGTKLVPAVRTVVEGGLDPALASTALQHLAEAEQFQWEIGTWASGSGEGLSSMFEVRTLQLARAWLLTAGASPGSSDSAQAADLARGVRDDPNNIARSLAEHVEALLKRL